MKVLIFTMGPGETSQGYAIAKEFHMKGVDIEFVLGKEINKPFLQGADFKSTIIPSSSRDSYDDLTAHVVETNPDGVLLCNSKSYARTDFVDKSPWPQIPTFTLDSNWLFNPVYHDFKYVQWADKYFINIPQKVFDDGLKINGGDFEIKKDQLDKMDIVGLVPSYAKISDDEIVSWRALHGLSNNKVIFCYVSGQGAGSRPWVLDNLIQATEKLAADKCEISIVIAGKMENNETLPSYCNYLGSELDMESFYTALSSSDLVFQHQGLATLTQSICAQVPVIANVADYPDDSIPQLHSYEVAPFEKNNVCKMLNKESSLLSITSTVESLLFNEDARSRMIEAQKNIYSKGEESILESIMQFLK